MQISPVMVSPEGIGPEQIRETASPQKEGLFAKLFAGLLQNNNHNTLNPEDAGVTDPQEESAGVPVKKTGRPFPALPGRTVKGKADLSGVFRDETPEQAGEGAEETGENSLPGAELLLSRIPDPFQPRIDTAGLAAEAKPAPALPPDFPPVLPAAEPASEAKAALPDAEAGVFPEAERPGAGEISGAEGAPEGVVPKRAAPEGPAGRTSQGDGPEAVPDDGVFPVQAAEQGQSPSREPLAGTRGRKSRDRLTVEVLDLRTEDPVQGEPGADFPSGGSGETELIVELRPGRGYQEDPGALREGRPASPSFEDVLARELRQNLNGDIVRHASFVLKDGGEGIIKLSLKPESLGNVKIHLEMTENKIAGRIVVENDEVLRAFEREMASLEQAFKDSGFAGASLEMAVASGGPGRHGENPEPGFYEKQQARLAASGYDASGDSPEGTAGPGAPAETRINMLV
jgi:hypothetical protein